MDLVRVKALIGNVERKIIREVAFLVNTRAYFPVIPQGLAEEWG